MNRDVEMALDFADYLEKSEDKASISRKIIALAKAYRTALQPQSVVDVEVLVRKAINTITYDNRNTGHIVANKIIRDTVELIASQGVLNTGWRGLNLQDLEDANVARQKDWTSEKWSLGEWMCALSGEVGEAANVVKKIFRGDKTLDEAREELAKEFADILTYLSIVSEKAGINLSRATISKFNEVSKRVNSEVTLPPPPKKED